MAYIKALKLNGFRNYTSLKLEADDSINIIHGPNGSGKTNILEAISLLSPGRGFRQAGASDILNAAEGLPEWAVIAELDSDDSIATGNKPGSEKRLIKINGDPVRSQEALLDYLAVIYLVPMMDQTFAAGSTSRRQYLDRIVALFNPEHTKLSAKFDHLRSERLNILSHASPDAAWIAQVEQKMAETAVAIAASRMEVIHMLQETIDRRDDPFPAALLNIEGVLERYLADNRALDTENHYKQLLEDSRSEDKYSGRTQYGTHRSDFSVVYKAKGVKAQNCSTGEQKALLLTLTLASVTAKYKRSGIMPILLLDEVVAHLDEDRRAVLAELLNHIGAQCWLTGTDAALFGGFSSAKKRFYVVDGAIIE